MTLNIIAILLENSRRQTVFALIGIEYVQKKKQRDKKRKDREKDKEVAIIYRVVFGNFSDR
jgi:hypothetical protein